MTADRSLGFVKMHGAGNDYVYIDGFEVPWLEETRLAERVAGLSDRNCGIGGDGVILLTAARTPDAAVRMVMWNADGSRGSFCGNGLRCLSKLARDHARVDRDDFAVETDAGTVSVRVLREHSAGIVTGARVGVPAARPDPTDLLIRLQRGAEVALRRVDVGNPHAVWWVHDVEQAPLAEIGRALQSHPEFPGGVNLEAAACLGPNHLRQRTWERGSGETMACGSGAVAVAAAARATGLVHGTRIRIDLNGGTLHVELLPDDGGAVLEGPAVQVYKGAVPWASDRPK